MDSNKTNKHMKRVIKAVSDTFENLKQKKVNLEQKKDHSTTGLSSFFNSDEKPLDVTVGFTSVVKVLLIVALFWFLSGIIIELKPIIILGFISFFVALSLAPICDAMESYRIPRPLSILILYAIFFGALGVLFVKVIPILGEQLFQLAGDFKGYFENGIPTLEIIKPWMDHFNVEMSAIEPLFTEQMSNLAKNLQNVAGSTFGLLTNVFKGVFNLIFALVLIFFILLERESIGSFFLSLFPKKDREYLQSKTNTVQRKMAQWIKAQVILMISVGLFMYAGMKVFEFTFDMKYSATIGLIAGFMELFPYLGVTTTGIVVLAVAVNISWTMVLVGLIWIALTQFLEGNFLVPVVMEKVVGLSSVATILALAAGGTLGYSIGGIPMLILGMILSVPIAATISIFIQEYANREGRK